jgi:hypothetical protein
MTSVRPAPATATALAMALLAAGAVTWAALPMTGAKPGARLALIVATGCAVASVACLAVSLATKRPGTRLLSASGTDGLRSPHGYHSPAAQVGLRLWLVISSGPWAQGMTIAVLALEALHQSRPWHTVVLGVVLLGYLLALHLAESAARPGVLRPQLPLIVGGVCLAGLSAGAAMFPATSSGAGWLSVLAAIAAVIVAALALPV